MSFVVSYLLAMTSASCQHRYAKAPVPSNSFSARDLEKVSIAGAIGCGLGYAIAGQNGCLAGGILAGALEPVVGDAVLGGVKQAGRSVKQGAAATLNELKTKPKYAKVHVFYATDRKSAGITGAAMFGGEASESLSFGTVDVSIPPTHKVTKIERPCCSWIGVRANPEKHITVLSVDPKTEIEFFRELSNTVKSSRHRDTFVFIHGFDTSFEQAVWRTAQIAHDLSFTGAPILYSWPSKGDVKDYFGDERTVRLPATRRHLEQFLRKVASESQAASVHVIAHSMGALALVTSLAGENTHLVQEIILAAPDIDADEFRQLAEAFKNSADRVTLYASSNDLALRSSKEVRGGYRRAGDTSGGVTVVQGVDTIDATNVDTIDETDGDTGLLRHSYFGDKRTILTDIRTLFLHNDPPDDRGMLRATWDNLPYWIFPR